MKKKNNFFLENYFKTYLNLVSQINYDHILNLSNELKKIKKNNNKILIFGNGAGAAISSHFSSDLAKTLKIKAYSFDNSAQITCFGNDYNFENWISKTLEVYLNKNDLVILLSASGNSKNMLKAANYLNKKKINFYSITGFNKNNKLNTKSSKYIWINSKSYNHIEVIQSMILLSSLDLSKKK